MSFETAVFIISNLAFPTFLLLAVIFAIILVVRGKIGKFDINDSFQRKYEIAGKSNSIIFNGGMNFEEGEAVDSKQIANRMSALLQEYHYQGLNQSKITFWFSIISASIGFMVILYSITLFINPSESIGASGAAGNPSSQNDWLETAKTPIFTAVSGTVIDVIAGLFFVQSNRARQLMSEFFDRLRVDRKLDESLRLIGTIEDKEIAGRSQALLAINLAEIRLDGPIFERIITGSYKKQIKTSEEKQGSSNTPG